VRGKKTKTPYQCRLRDAAGDTKRSGGAIYIDFPEEGGNHQRGERKKERPKDKGKNRHGGQSLKMGESRGGR